MESLRPTGERVDCLAISQEVEIETRQDPVDLLEYELMMLIFSHLDIGTLAKACLVNRSWKEIASNPLLWRDIIYRDVAFSSANWTKHFGKDCLENQEKAEEQNSFPFNIREILGSSCSIDFFQNLLCLRKSMIFEQIYRQVLRAYVDIWSKNLTIKMPKMAILTSKWSFERSLICPGKQVGQTHKLVFVPHKVNGTPLTLTSLGELIKTPREGHKTQYGYYWGAAKEQHGNTPNKGSHWILMNKRVIPESWSESYTIQQQLVTRLVGGYQVPSVLDAAVCILMEHVETGVRLFPDHPWTYTRCQEATEGYQVVVGAFARAGLNVSSGSGTEDDGVTALRMF